ncbi:hypothetical protein PFICI_04681 [Pestalotiopsis fici W106-1]|uniref:Zn(2)-C6 fungal-type domain-containing protein n=1 Tax=Pestalotiopsis fici (strain W106-1 / CGMCC3.15140) TaxID=1229662 RepID=W3X9S4_PESFW|nr:uncharacterized protein PFICI_04681 [Pestalotiopsis fici W106-1]ETS82805.1 hypothetical protein PFICI_04681 [Pestalotiopsis fici W106-1]
MDVLLSQYGISVGGSDAPRSAVTSGNASVEELQHELHDIVASKRSETRAEHISTSLELRMTAVLNVPQEPEQLADNLEQLLEPMTRTVTVSETVLNQPTDDPKLQRSVAKYLAGSLAVVDDSLWAVRSVSRTAQGWSFIYHCQHSLQAWNRQNAKKPDRQPIASFSGPGGLDTVNLSRPAFDCRGTLSISFSKSSRAIVVKYEHTPLHKTVAELVERLLPTLPPPPVPNVNTPNVSRSAKAKRPPPTDGEESSRKKPKKKKKKKGTDDGDEAAQPGSQATSQPPEETSSGSQPPSALNIPPLEAARRREVANNLLMERGIDPATLSEEQFSIFSNQAPNLQEASLDMLAKYGAERLRIVHPDEKGPSAPASSTPAQQVSVGDGTDSASATATETPTKKRKPRAKKSDAVVVEDAGDEGPAVASASKRDRKTRGTCNTCKLAKRKCTKEHPQCSVCEELGETCVYLPPKPRKKLGISADVAVDEDDDSEAVGQGSTEQSLLEHVAPTVQVPPAAAVSHDDDEFIPDPNILAGPTQPGGPPPYYHQAEVAEPSPQPLPQHHDATGPGLDYPQPEIHQEVHHQEFAHDVAQQPHHHYPGLTFSNTRPAQASPEISYATTKKSSTRRKDGNARHSLPTAQSLEPAKASNASGVNASSTTNWRRGTNQSPAMNQRTSTASPTLPQAQPQPSKGRSTRKSVADPSDSPFDSYQAAAVLAQTPIPVPVPRVAQSPALSRSPFQTAQKSPARAKSRQGQRSQSRTPVTQTPVPPPVIPTAHAAPSTQTFDTSTPASSASIPAYNPFARYNGTGNDQYSQSTTAGQSTRIAYEPNTYNQQTSTSTSSNAYNNTSSYGYSRDNTQSNPLNQALHDSSDFGSTTNTNNTNQWPSQTRSSRSSGLSNSSSNAYKTTAPAQASSNQLYGSRASQHQTAAHGSDYSQSPQTQSSQNQHQRQQSYGSSYTQQTSGDQQNQNWYGFTTANSNTDQTSYGTGSRNAGYNMGSSSAGFNPNAYGQDLYELLRNSGNH